MKNNNTTAVRRPFKSSVRRSKWIHLDYLKYPIHDVHGNVILPAGTPDVSVVFRGGCFTYVNDLGNRVRVNKYRDSDGRIYYGH